MSGPIPIKLEAALLRSQLPELVLREGMVMAARVLERNGQRGVLSMAGRQIAAELPPGLEAGATVKLRVQEAGDERIVLRLVEQPATQAAANTAQMVAVPLPDGTQARLAVQPDAEGQGAGGAGSAAQTVSVTWQSAALGTLGLRLILQPGGVFAVVEAGARGIDVARGGAEHLKAELAAITNRPADVKVIERRDPTDFYA